MAEYIDRDAAIAACFDGFADCRDDCAANIRNLPAADVEEVVRCKDCFNRTKSGMCIQWSRYEKIVNTPDYAFCSWGVKIDGRIHKQGCGN